MVGQVNGEWVRWQGGPELLAHPSWNVPGTPAALLWSAIYRHKSLSAGFFMVCVLAKFAALFAHVAVSVSPLLTAEMASVKVI